MQLLKKTYYRTYQKVFYIASFFLPWREPELLKGEGSFLKLPEKIALSDINRVLVVTDRGLMKIGLLDSFFDKMEEQQISYVVFDEVVPNPTIGNVEKCVEIYQENHCQGIIAVGGGSPMDCAKAAGARIVKPNKPVPKMKGVLKVLKKLPPLYAVPTTAGTGSETTLAAVITDSKTHHKYAINDPSLIPACAVLDPALTVNLPKHITSTTGMDALCHAVEAYIGKGNTKKTKSCSIKAVCLIFDNLYEAYQHGENMQARKNMQEAAYLAGVAFTRAYVGWVHAIAHTLGGFYQTPHGLANAVIMPYVFRVYGKSAHKKLAELADVVSIRGNSEEEKAEMFIRAIENLNKKMDIPAHLSVIREEDIDQMAAYAAMEANPLYPTPKILFEEDAKKLYRQIKHNGQDREIVKMEKIK